jgi:hypothetical protein
MSETKTLDNTEELTPLEKFQRGIHRSEILSEPGFFNQWLFYFMDKVIDNSQKESFDFHLLYQEELALNY